MRLVNAVSTRRIIVLAMLAVGLATSAKAQERKGFYFGVGMGYGSLGIGCEGCQGAGRESGLSGHLRLGGTVSQHVQLGVESTGWYKSEQGAELNVGTLTGNIYVYPRATTPLFLKGGLGLGALTDGYDSQTGFGWQAGAGYDIRLGTKTALTPTLTYFMGHFDGGSTNVMQFALAFSLY